MKKKIVLILLGLLLFNLSFGQDQQKYSELVNEAFKLYQNREYYKSGQKYTEAFNSFKNSIIINDRLVAASTWSLAKEIDSSFVQLFKLAQDSNFIYYNHLIITSDLSNVICILTKDGIK